MDANTERASSHKERVHQLWATYDSLIKNGHYAPFGYPFGALPFLMVIVYFIVPAKYTPRPVRIIWALSAQALCLHFILFTRARSAATSGLLGIGFMYFIQWITANMIVFDAKTSYERIVRVEHDKQPGSSSESKGLVSYAWQPIPNIFKARLDWIMDLLTNLDGMGWNWAISALPAPPKRIREQLKTPGRLAYSRDILEAWKGLPPDQPEQHSKAVYRDIRWRLAIGYMALDAAKTMGSMDPFFWGYTDHVHPPYLPSWLQYRFVVKIVRLCIAQASMHIAIRTLLTLRPLHFLSKHGQPLVGIRGEGWLFPDPFGSFQAVLDYGLPGFWSSYWHQSFRHVFTAPSRPLIAYLGLDPRSVVSKFIRMSIAFLCSGLLHASLSVGAIGQTRPLRGPLLFFVLQPIGVALQIMFVTVLQRASLGSWVSPRVGGFVNLAWCLVWGYLTAPLLIEDLAKGGQFLFEPVPFSIFRGLGLGNSDDGFWCWSGRWLSFRSDIEWWKYRIVS
ncbi:hypothetical protein BT63DRAFT_424723 [Microthyrium microscopicum]|uniref:Wax synthase domain-containing protein n=1 Tax=Microthyrium microscopicum TaxID=703497 RepID=A0A6A6UC09_9PEZI|nr:hypothetical protein BT63DRAFT_424723 [Microthyrium microscopicum]